ncbi:hypothetical protein D3C80_382670 [compost metagenome]
MVGQKLVKRRGLLPGGGQENLKFRQAHFRESAAARRRAAQRKPQAAGGAGEGGRKRRVDRLAGQGCGCDLQRRDLHRLRGAKTAAFTADGFGEDFTVPWERLHGCERRARGELHHAHGRDGRKIVRIERFQQALRQFGKFVVQFLAHTGGGVGEALDQPLDMRIVGDISRHAQPAGDFRERRRETRCAFSQGKKFIIVFFEKAVSHSSPPPGNAAWTDRSGIRN